MSTNYQTQIRQEAEHWDRINSGRALEGYIPLEADIRRATAGGRGRQDPVIDRITFGSVRDVFIDRIAHTPGGRVLDVCCGPGWLSLELARRNQRVDAYDLSPSAIALGERMLIENPFRDTFGEVHYHVGDITTVDLGEGCYDAVAGWSAFHHLKDFPEFIRRVRSALKPGGIVATLDDLPTGRKERLLGLFFSGLLPIVNLTYRQKLVKGIRHLLPAGKGKTQSSPIQGLSPMEAFCTHEIEPLFAEHFKVLERFRFNAFAHSVAGSLKGSDRLRRITAKALTRIDRWLCWSGLVQGTYQMIIARKTV